MEAGLLIGVSIEKRGEAKDLEGPFPGIIEFIEKRAYLSVTDPRGQTITMAVDIDAILAPMKAAFFDKGAD